MDKIVDDDVETAMNQNNNGPSSPPDENPPFLTSARLVHDGDLDDFHKEDFLPESLEKKIQSVVESQLRKSNPVVVAEVVKLSSDGTTF